MGNVTILDKSDVLSGLFGTWDSLDTLLGGLSEQQWQTPTPLPGWCVHNVVAHIIGTESLAAGTRYCPTPISMCRRSIMCATAWARSMRPGFVT